MNLEHKQNLADLADWLEVHHKETEDSYDLIVAGLVEGRFNIKNYNNNQQEYLNNCGTAGCAIGWATYAIEPRNMKKTEWGQLGEPWHAYACRLFGTHDSKAGAGTFMFSGNWGLKTEKGSVADAISRIRTVLQLEGATPEVWPHWDDTNSRVTLEP